MKLVAALLLLLSFVALAGCSGSSGGGSTPTQDAQGRYVIHMTSGNAFSPKVAHVPANATVVWVHDGGAPHDVTADDGSFGSDKTVGHKLMDGDEFTHQFTATGTVAYKCTLHEGSGMKGTIVVE